MNTGDLYSGMNSGSFGTNKAVKRQRDDIKTDALELKATLLPAYKQIVTDLDNEITVNKDLTKFMTGSYVTDDELRFELAARTRYVDFLSKLKTKYESATKGVTRG